MRNLNSDLRALRLYYVYFVSITFILCQFLLILIFQVSKTFFGVVFVLYENLQSKFSLILFAYNLMIGYLKKNRENYLREYFV